MYRLKTNVADFEVVDGKFAGRKYTAGQIYHEIPAEESHKFDPEYRDAQPCVSTQGGDEEAEQ